MELISFESEQGTTDVESGDWQKWDTEGDWMDCGSNETRITVNDGHHGRNEQKEMESIDTLLLLNIPVGRGRAAQEKRRRPDRSKEDSRVKGSKSDLSTDDTVLLLDILEGQKSGPGKETQAGLEPRRFASEGL